MGFILKIHFQLLESSRREGEAIIRGRGAVEVMMGKPTETADLSLWELMDSEPTAGVEGCMRPN